MINVEFDRNNYKVECGGCGVEIQPEAPSWRLDFEYVLKRTKEVVDELIEQ